MDKLAAEVKALRLASKAVKVVKKAKRASKAGKSGGFFGSIGKSLGGAAGSFLGGMASKALMSITGMGDYKVHRNSLYVHSLTSSPPPVFRSDSHSTRIVHHEFLGDVGGSGDFVRRFRLPINPGNPATFPWLSTMAVLFEEYKFHGLIFEFKSTSGVAVSSTNSALGTLLMATQYNVYQPDFVSKQQMDSYEYTVTTRPDCSALHPVECDPRLNGRDQFFVDTSQFAPGGDLRLTNMGTFYIYVAGQQANLTSLGELWVSYDVELIKPRLAANVQGASEANSAIYYNGSATSGGAQGPFIASDMFIGMRLLPDASGDQQLTIKPSQSNFPISFGSATTFDPNTIYFPPGCFGKFLLLWTLRISTGTSTPPFILPGASAPSFSVGNGITIARMTSFDRSTLATNSSTDAVDVSYSLTSNQNAATYYIRYIVVCTGSSTTDPITNRSNCTIKFAGSPFSSAPASSVTWANTFEVYPVFL